MNADKIWENLHSSASKKISLRLNALGQCRHLGGLLETSKSSEALRIKRKWSVIWQQGEDPEASG